MIDFADIAQSIASVLAIGLLFGAGLPAVFAFGMRALAAGEGGEDADGVVQQPQPAMKIVGYALYALVALAVAFGILWITRQTLLHHFGWQIFPSAWY